MPTCPTCHAEFSNQKLLSIHQKYCGRKDDQTDSDANFSTEKIRRSDILNAIDGDGTLADDVTPADPPQAPIPSTATPLQTPMKTSAPFPAEPTVDPELSPLQVAVGLDPEGTYGDFGSGLTNLYEDSKGRLKLSVKPFEGLLLVKASGSLVVWTSLQLGAAIKKLLASGGRYVILEVSDVEECDASGLGALLLFNQELKDLGGRLALSAPVEAQQKFECIRGFTRAVEFHPNLEAAVRAFRALKQ